MVRCFMNGNSVNPGFQTAIAVKTLDALEDFHKNVLQNIRGVGLILNNMPDQVEDRILIDRQKVCKSVLRTRSQFSDKCRLFIPCRQCVLERDAYRPRGAHDALKIPVLNPNFNTGPKRVYLFLLRLTPWGKGLFQYCGLWRQKMSIGRMKALGVR